MTMTTGKKVFLLITVLAAIALMLGAETAMAKGKIVHDAEHNILKAQHGERWAKEDAEIDTKLAEIRKKNGGKRPNILYILIDDLS